MQKPRPGREEGLCVALSDSGSQAFARSASLGSFKLLGGDLCLDLKIAAPSNVQILSCLAPKLALYSKVYGVFFAGSSSFFGSRISMASRIPMITMITVSPTKLLKNSETYPT